MTDPIRIEFETPLQRKSVAEMVVRRILDMVKSGVLKAGDALPPERDSDAIAFRKSDFEFHEIIWIGSGNALLKRIGESLNVIGSEFRKRASAHPGVLEQSPPAGCAESARPRRTHSRGPYAERIPIHRCTGRLTWRKSDTPLARWAALWMI